MAGFSGNRVIRDFLLAKFVSSIGSSRKIIDIHVNATIRETMAIMMANDITSIPVYGTAGTWKGAGGSSVIIGTKQYIGIATIYDVVLHILIRINQLLAEHHNVNVDILLQMGSVDLIIAENIHQVIGDTPESQLLFSDSETQNVLYVMKMMSSLCHRLLLINPTNTTTTRILSQTDVLSFILQNKSQFVRADGLNLLDLSLHDASCFSKNIKCVGEDSLVMGAFQVMSNANTPALPVISFLDGTAKLVTTLSASDLRSMIDVDIYGRPKSSVFRTRSLTVGNFLKMVHNNSYTQPIVCEMQDSLESVIRTMLQHHIHHVWIEVIKAGSPSAMTGVVEGLSHDTVMGEIEDDQFSLGESTRYMIGAVSMTDIISSLCQLVES